MDTRQEQIQQLADEIRNESGVPGLALSLARNGQQAFVASGVARVNAERSIGADARFDLSCLMKFFLSVTALKLAAQGRLDLQADISSLLPELGPARGIQLVNLMSHTGGYHGLDITDMTVRWNSKWDSFAARFRERSQLFPPGMTFNYEHSEHVVLGEALRRLFGQSPSRLVTDTLLAPIGVAPQDASASDATVSSHAYSVQKGAYIPARLPPFGPFWEASLPAMTITLDEIIAVAGAAFADRDIAAGLRAAVAGLPEMARSEPRAERPPRHFSAACGIYEDGLLGHNGSMAGQTIGFRSDPQTGAIAVAAVNAYSPHARDGLLRRALDFAAGRNARPSQQRRGEPLVYPGEFLFDGVAPQALTGRYIGSYLGEVRIDASGDGLDVTVGPAGNRQNVFKIARIAAGYAIQSKMPVAMRFTKAADGTPVLYLGVHAYKAD